MGVTNLKTVQAIKEQSLLKGVALAVYEIIAMYPGLTVGEITTKYYGKGDDDTALGRSRNELAKRVSDLTASGAVRADGKALCPYTGRFANRYVATGNLPAKRERKPDILSGLMGNTSAPQVQAPQLPYVLLFRLRVLCITLQTKWYAPKSLKVTAKEAQEAIDKLVGIA